MGLEPELPKTEFVRSSGICQNEWTKNMDSGGVSRKPLAVLFLQSTVKTSVIDQSKQSILGGHE